MTYKAFPGGHEINNFGKSFLCHHYYTLGLSESWPGVEMMIFFKKYINFTFLTPNLPLFGVRYHESNSFLSPYPINVARLVQ